MFFRRKSSDFLYYALDKRKSIQEMMDNLTIGIACFKLGYYIYKCVCMCIYIYIYIYINE